MQVLRLCQKTGLVKLGHVALDGTKIKANASKHKAMGYKRMKEEESRLESEVMELLKKAEIVDEEEDQRYGKNNRGDELPKELPFRESRLKKIWEAAVRGHGNFQEYRAGEAHLIQKGQYRIIPPGIEHVEKFHKKDVKLGTTNFEMLYQDGKGERQFLPWAQSLKVDFKRIRHLSFTSSTNVVHVFVEPSSDLIPVLLARMPDLAGTVIK